MPPCYEKAVQLLASRPHFRRELAGKLLQRGYPADEMEATLDRLTEQGYLDDSATARASWRAGWPGAPRGGRV